MVNKKWIINRVTHADVSTAERLLADFEASARTGQNFVARFERFVQANEALRGDPGSLMLGFFGQLVNCGLKFSTIEVYMKQARNYLRNTRDGETVESKPKLNRLIKLAKFKAAEEPTKQARQVSDTEAWAIIQHATATQQVWLSLMFFTGSRWKDLSRLLQSQVQLRPKALKIRYRVMKNRRSRDLRTTIVIKEGLGIKLPPVLRSFLKTRTSSSEPLFRDVTTYDLNQALKVACFRSNVPRITTYSLRHTFVKRVLRYCEKTGEPPTKFTGHLKQSTIDAHYDELDHEAGESDTDDDLEDGEISE
jgi:integrase